MGRLRLTIDRVASSMEDRVFALASAVLPGLGRGTRQVLIDPMVQRERGALVESASPNEVLREPSTALSKAR